MRWHHGQNIQMQQSHERCTWHATAFIATEHLLQTNISSDCDTQGLYAAILARYVQHPVNVHWSHSLASSSAAFEYVYVHWQ